jgi:hypothetical protein
MSSSGRQPVCRSWRQLLLLLSIHPVAWSRKQIEKFGNGFPQYGVPGTQHDTWWHYLSKFAFDTDGGRIAIRLRTRDGPKPKTGSKAPLPVGATVKMDLMIYVDTTWNKVPDMENKKHCIGDPSIPEPDFIATIDFTNSPTWGEWTTQEVDPAAHPHVWHFVLSDCEHMLPNYKIEYEMEVTQVDGSQFSVERKYSLGAHMTAAVCFGLLALWWWRRISNMNLRTNFQIHPILWIVSIQLGLQLLGHIGHLWHLTDYSSDGIGDEFIDAVSEGMFMMNQVLQASLFITIGLGYTIISTLDFYNDSFTIWNIVIFMMVIHATLVFIARVSGTDQAHRFHGHEGAVGWVTAIIRGGFYFWFLSVCSQTESLLEDQYKKLRGFFFRFQVMGSVSFLSYPLTFFILPFIAEYWRHRVLQLSMLSIQFFISAWFAKLILDSGYFLLRWEVVDDQELPVHESELPTMMSSVPIGKDHFR